MLITTSRKPSSKTRKFCKNFSHATGSEYVNRGKSNFREILLKAKELEEDYIAIVNEIKSNPSKITFYSSNGDVKIAILIAANISKDRLHIKIKDLKIKSDFDRLDLLCDVFQFEKTDEDLTDNYIHILPSDDDDKIAKIDFYNKFGDLSDFQIFVKKISDPSL